MAAGMVVRDPVTGTWRGRVDLQRDADGRRRQVRVHGRTKAECEAKVRKVLDEDTRGLIPAKGRNAYTVSDAADAWLATKRGRSSRTIDSYQGEIDRHIRPVLGRVLVTALRRSDVEHAIAHWETTPRKYKRGGSRSSTSVRYYITLLYGIIELAKDDG